MRSEINYHLFITHCRKYTFQWFIHSAPENMSKHDKEKYTDGKN